MSTVTFTWRNARRADASGRDAYYSIEKPTREEADELALAAFVGNEALGGRRFGTCTDRVLRRICTADTIEVEG